MQGYGAGNSHLTSTLGRFVAGLLVGGLLGAGAMLLLAPQAGKKTQHQIQQEGIELRDQVTETVEHAVEQVRGKGRRVAAGLQKQGKDLQQRAQGALDGQVEIASQVIEAEQAAAHDLRVD